MAHKSSSPHSWTQRFILDYSQTKLLRADSSLNCPVLDCKQIPAGTVDSVCSSMPGVGQNKTDTEHQRKVWVIERICVHVIDLTTVKQ